MSAAVAVRPGTVVRYRPDPSRHDPRWCREGIAVADAQGRLLDTYWSTGSEAHRVTAAEAESIEVLFHLEDYDELDRWRPDAQKWATYAEAERRRITSQHGLEQRLFIRKGAVPHRETVLAGLRAALEQAEHDADSAARRLRWAREDVEALEAAPAECSCRPTLCARDAGCTACAGITDWMKCPALPARMNPAPD